MVTLKDIAKECRVSFSTVSKALKGSSEISADTIKMIQTKAEEMGYHPNLAARTLRTNRTYDIGVIFEDKTGAGFQHEYFATVISGIQRVAQEKGYEMTFIGINGPNDDYYHHAMSRNYDGVAILSCDFDSDGIKNLVRGKPSPRSKQKAPHAVLFVFHYPFQRGHPATPRNYYVTIIPFLLNLIQSSYYFQFLFRKFLLLQPQ